MGRYALFLGCQIPMRIPSVEMAARGVFEKLGLEMSDLKGYSCCPEPVISRLLDEKAWLTVSARNITLAEELGLDLATLCNGCYETLLEANVILKRDKKMREHVNGILRRYGREYRGAVNVKHIVEVLYEDVGLEKIKEHVAKPLRIRVALHYGCHLYREPNGGDIMRKPDMMRRLAEATGATVVNYGLERLCCGYPSMQVDEEFSLNQRLLPKLRRIKDAGADAVILTCPACNIQFETGQALLRARGIRFDIPCLNLMELLALSFGVPYENLHLEVHRSPVLQFAKRLEGD